MNQPAASYLLAGQPTEFDRLQVQSRVWEPAGRALLAHIPHRAAAAALDVGCGVMGWLRILSEWVGADGRVVGSDIDEKMLASAQAFVEAERLGNVALAKDDVFSSRLPAWSFELVHARFQLAPLGRVEDQFAAYTGFVKPGGWLVLEEPDISSWRVNPDAPAVQQVIHLLEQGFQTAGGDFNAGRSLPVLFRHVGVEPEIDAHVVALRPGHPYLRLPLQFATALRPRLEALVGRERLDELLQEADAELARPGTWGTTFMLLQAYASLAGQTTT